MNRHFLRMGVLLVGFITIFGLGGIASAKHPLTITADAKTKFVGEADPDLTYSAVGLEGRDKLSGTLSREPGESVGSYAIKIGTLKVSPSDKYEITFIPANLTIKALPDTVAPIISSHSDVIAEATSASGANATYILPTVSDNVDHGLVASCIPASGSVFSFGDTVVTCTAKDTTGNDAQPVTFKVTVKDTTKPVVSFGSVPDLTNETTPIINFNVADVSAAEAECKIDGGEFTSCSSPFQVSPALEDGVHTIYVKATDSSGNASDIISHSLTVNTKSPNLSIDTFPKNLVNTQSVTFSFSTDQEVETKCKIDDGEAVVCSSPYTFNGLTEGRHTATIIATDSLGNHSEKSQSFIVDLTPPVISLKGDVSTTTENTVTFTDPGATCEDNFDKTCEVKVTGSIDYTKLGDNTLKYSATDEAGNTSEVTRTVKVVDTTDPVGTVEYSETKPTNKDVVATVKVNEPVSFLNEGGDSHTFSENGVFSFEFKDTAGLVGFATATVSNIDKVAPEITLGDYETQPVDHAITVYATTTEGVLNETSHVFTENGSFDFVAIDEAGNVATKTVTITNISKPVAPIITSAGTGGGSAFLMMPFVGPEGGFKIELDKVMSSSTVSLKLDGGPKAVRMALSNTEDFAGAIQIAYATITVWNLGSGEGAHKVYVKFYDIYGQTSPTISASVTINANLTGQVLGVKISIVDELISKLKFRQRNSSVKELQGELKRLGFFPKWHILTTYYGPITKASVQKYLSSKAI